MDKRVRILFLLVIVFILLPIIEKPAMAANAGEIATNSRFGDATFDPDRTMTSKDQIYLFEKGDYTIVYWVIEEPFTTENVYMSVAKKNKWLFRGKKVMEIPWEPYISMLSHTNGKQYILMDNYFFYYLDGKIQAAVFNIENGTLTAEKELEKSIRGEDVFVYVGAGDKSGVMLGSAVSGYRIYLEGELSKPLRIFDSSGVLTEKITKATPILAGKRDQIIFYGWENSTIYDISHKKMIADANGNEKKYKLAESQDIRFYGLGKFFVIRQNFENASIRIFDDRFNLLKSVPFYLAEPIEIFNIAAITVKSNNVRLWNIVTDKHNKLSYLQLTQYKP